MTTFGPTLADTGKPITFGAAGAPHIFWRAPRLTPEPFSPPAVAIETRDRGVFTASTWARHGDYAWARFVGTDVAIMGAHFTQRTVAEGMIECALHVPNAVCDPQKPGSFCGAVNYESLTITAPTGWLIAHEFALREQPGSGPHFWPSLASKTYRFVLYRQPRQREEAGRVLRCEHLQFNEALPMGPQRTMIPVGAGLTSIAGRTHIGGGWSPLGEPSPDAVGGGFIAPLSCMPLSPENAHEHRIRADLMAQRNLCVAYHAADGHPIAPSEWGEPPGWEYLTTAGFPQNQRIPAFTAGRTDDYANAGQHVMTSRLARISPFGQFWADKCFNASNNCPYEWALRQWYRHDGAHLWRAYQDNATAAVLLNDTICKLRQTAYACDTMTSWNMHHSPGLWDGSFSLEKALAQATANPHKGGHIPRIVGECSQAVAWDLILQPPGAQRVYEIAWCGKMLDYCVLAATPAYMPQDGHGSKDGGAENGTPWVWGLPTNKGECPYFQIPIWATGVYSMAMAAHGARTRIQIKDLVVQSALELYGNALISQPDRWSQGAFGPGYYVVTSTDGVLASNISEAIGEPYNGKGTTNALHCWHHVALAMEWATGADLERLKAAALVVRYPSKDLIELSAKCSPVDPWSQHMRGVLMGAAA